MKRQQIDFEFVEFMPPELKAGVVYISTIYSTASHLCMCGCGERIVTPFSPTDWKLMFDGDSISIFPSIGNWDLACRSHYYITNNTVEWAPAWTKEQVARARIREELDKRAYYGSTSPSSGEVPNDDVSDGAIHRLLRFLGFKN